MNNDMFLSLGVMLLALSSLVLAFVVGTRNQKSPVGRSFAAFAFTTSLWMIANYVGSNFKDHSFATYFIHADFALGPLLVYLLWHFTSTLLVQAKPDVRTYQHIFGILFLPIGILISLGTFFPAFVSVVPGGHEELLKIKYGNLFMIYDISVLVAAILAVINIVVAKRSASGRLRAQINVMLLGIVLFALLLSSVNLVLPFLTKSANVNLIAGNLAYLGIMAFVWAAAYAVIRHHLFDVRTVVIRVVAYVVTMSIIITLYSLSIVFFVARLVALDEISAIQLLLLAVPTVICTVTFPYIKRAVDRLTSKIFYHDVYLSRDVLYRLSESLVGENDAQKLSRRSVAILADVIHPTIAYVASLDEKGRIVEEYSLTRNDYANLENLIKSLGKVKGTIISKDDHENHRLGQKMQEAQIDLAIRLRSESKHTGYILFGPKMSGSAYSNQDIKLLKAAANNLAVALENAKKYEQIKHFAETLKEEVAHATTRLKHANERLKTLDELKDDFISMASHQFRTPANSVRQALQMINDPKLSDKERKEMLRLAEANSEQLVTIVGAMLNMSRIQAGRFTLDRSLVDLNKLIDKILLSTNILAEQKDIKIEIDRPKGPVLLEVDNAKITEAMKNYLENAIKYTPEHNTINVRLYSDNMRVYYDVKDEGIGVPEPERKKLFTKFYRANNARREHPDGNGIGLYVVNTIVEQHGGDVYYEPQNPGSLFGFWLPLP